MVAGRLGLSTSLGYCSSDHWIHGTTVKNVKVFDNVIDSIKGFTKIFDESSKPRADKPFSMPKSVSSDKEFLVKLITWQEIQCFCR